VDAVRAGTVEAAVRRALSSLPERSVRIARDVARTLALELDRAS
jgi:hypothetical protein